MRNRIERSLALTILIGVVLDCHSLRFQRTPRTTTTHSRRATLGFTLGAHSKAVRHGRNLLNASSSDLPYVHDRCVYVARVGDSHDYDGFNAMTLDVCYSFCTSFDSFYFGVRGGRLCWCGNKYDAYIGAGPGRCNIPCEGNPAQICGGEDEATDVFIMGGPPCNLQPFVPTLPPLATTTSTSTTTTTTGLMIPLLPTDEIKLQKDDKFVTWGGALQQPSSTDEQVWYLRKCSGTGASACLGQDEAWTSTTSAIKTGDVVAWVSKSSGQVYDCAGSPCTQQPYPPPHGHWGTPYRISKVNDDGTVAADETAISPGDSVYFFGMRNNVWTPTWIIDCSSSSCGGSSSNTIAGSTFTLQLAQADR